MGQVVTSHLYAQRFGRSAGFVTTGLLLGCVPQSMLARGVDEPTQPISEIVMALRLSREEPIRNVSLTGNDLERTLAALDALELCASLGRAQKGELGAHFERNKAFGLVHLRFGTGAPPRRLHAGFVEGLEAAGTRVLWADVPIDHGDSARVVERLRDLGMGYAAYIPAAGVHGEDVLRFQRYLGAEPLDAAAIHVIDEARAIAADVYADASRLEAVSS
jgi:hypothetical protein